MLLHAVPTISQLEARIAGFTNHLGELNERAVGKIIVVLDESARQLHLVGELRADLLQYFNPASSRQADILTAVSQISGYLGAGRLQLHSNLPLPPEVQGQYLILGGAAAYYDGIDTLYFNAKSEDHRDLTKRLLLRFFTESGTKTIFGSDICDIDRLWRPELDLEVAWALKI